MTRPRGASDVRPSLPLIPYPHTLIRKEGTCRLGPDSAVLVAPGADDLALWAAPLLDLLRRGTGLALPMKLAVQDAQQTQSRPFTPLAPAQFSAQPPPHASITLACLTGQPAEATTLDITEGAVVLRAADREGAVWGRVLSVPKRVRWHLREKPEAASGLLRVFLRAVETAVRRTCLDAPPGSRYGAVAFVHRFGDALNSHVHSGSTSTCW